MHERWQDFLASLSPESPVRTLVVESWERCHLAGMKPGDLSIRRASAEELAQRLETNAELVRIGRPHLEWLLLSAGPLRPVAVMLTDRDGVILASTSNVPAMLEQYGLVPGCDWSEMSMGTNGIGTAIATKTPVAILGPEHYLEAIHDYTCVGAPIQAADGTVLGAIDLCTRAVDGDPSRLVLTAYAARTMAQELAASPQKSASHEDLLAVAAHEMKTPLTTLLVLARAIRQTADQTPLPPRAIDRFEQQVQRLVDITSGILDVAQMKSPAASELAQVDLAALARETASMLEERTLGEDAPRLVRVDAAASVVGRWPVRKVRGIVTNLLSNALKYGDGKPVVVTVGQVDGAARLVVRDHGLGIPPEQRERVFQRFVRAPETSRNIAGHGLGLWIASELASSMGGRVSLEPTDGDGTTFAVVLPLKG